MKPRPLDPTIAEIARQLFDTSWAAPTSVQRDWSIPRSARNQSASGSRRGGAFPIEDLHGPAIEVICPLLCFANTDDPELPEFGKCANQMERDAFACRSVEVQTVYDGDVDKVIRRETL